MKPKPWLWHHLAEAAQTDSPTVLRKAIIWAAAARWRQSQGLGFLKFSTPLCRLVKRSTGHLTSLNATNSHLCGKGMKPLKLAMSVVQECRPSGLLSWSLAPRLKFGTFKMWRISKTGPSLETKVLKNEDSAKQRTAQVDLFVDLLIIVSCIQNQEHATCKSVFCFCFLFLNALWLVLRWRENLRWHCYGFIPFFKKRAYFLLRFSFLFWDFYSCAGITVISKHHISNRFCFLNLHFCIF